MTQVIAYVVFGVGFLGAGAIMKEGTNVRGLNTAATVWCSAAADQVQVAVATTVGVVFLNVMMSWVLGRFENKSAVVPTTAAALHFTIRIACSREHMAHIRLRLPQALKQASLTPTALTSSNGLEHVQIIARLTGAAAEVEQVVARLGGEPAISSIGWQHATNIQAEA